VSDHASNGWSYVGWVLSWCAVMRFRLGGSASVSLKEGEVHLFFCLSLFLYGTSIPCPFRGQSMCDVFHMERFLGIIVA
jgi:hypothetical protein